MHFSSLLPITLAFTAAKATYQGFNYGSTFTDGSPKHYQDFVNEFNTAQQLVGAPGFNSARLYTMVQGGTASDPIEALQAAVDTKSTLLLGAWASGGDASFANEMTALKAAIAKFPNLGNSIAGISVGSEDLYRDSPIGIENMSGVGVGPDVITNYINQVRDALKNTAWSKVPVGHVDTWTAWVNGSNSGVVAASDFLGVDAYPYFQTTMSNGIESAQSLFNQAISNTQGASQGKSVWITETGWPYQGKTANLAVPSIDNAKTYWDEVGCANFGKTNIWWYTLQDAAPTTPDPTFGLVGSTLTTTPVYNLTCPAVSASSSSSPSSSSSSPSSNGDSPASSGSNSAVPTAGGVSPSKPGTTPIYNNGTSTRSSGAAASTGSSSSGGSRSGSGSGSGTSSGSGSSGSGAPLQGSGSATIKGSVAGVLGAVAAAVMLL